MIVLVAHTLMRGQILSVVALALIGKQLQILEAQFAVKLFVHAAHMNLEVVEAPERLATIATLAHEYIVVLLPDHLVLKVYARVFRL